MGRVDDIAKRFSLAGVLDEDRQAKQRFPVEEIEVAAIEDHPANVAYSMDEDGIKSLAESIRKDGLTDIPMVRRKPDGGFQMLSGHRRKADTSKLIREAGGPGAEAVGKLVAKALKTLRKAAGAADGSAVVDASQLDEIERCVRDLRTIAGSK